MVMRVRPYIAVMCSIALLVFLKSSRRMIRTLNWPRKLFQRSPNRLASSLTTFLYVSALFVVCAANNPHNKLDTVNLLPNWLPGAGFKRHAIEGHKLAMDVLNLPFAMGKGQTVSERTASGLRVGLLILRNRKMNGPAFPSILNEMIKERIDKGLTDDEELIKAITSVMYIGEQVQTSL